MAKKDQRATITGDVDCAGSGHEIWRGKFAEDVAECDHLLAYGYKEAAHERVALFAKYLRKGLPIPRKYFLSFCDQLDRIAAGENPQEVLGPKKSTKGSPNMKRLHRLNDIANRMSKCVMGGQTLQDAVEEIQEESDGGISERQARLAWEVFGKAYRELEKPFGRQGLPNLEPLKRGK